MRIAHVLYRGEPTLALWRDGQLLDVRKLEERMEIEASPLAFTHRAADFHGRIFSLGGAGLSELEQTLGDGYVPTDTVMAPDECTYLPPIGRHPALLEFSVRADDRVPRFRWGNARCLVGHGAPLLVPPDEPTPQMSAQLAVILGEDLRNADEHEAQRGIAGFALLSLWRMPSRERVSPGWGSFRVGQIGPTLLREADPALPEKLDVSIFVNGERVVVARARAWRQSFAQMVAFASEVTDLSAGDIIATGPLARLSSNGGRALRDGDRIDVKAAGMGELSGTLLVSGPPSTFLPKRHGDAP